MNAGTRNATTRVGDHPLPGRPEGPPVSTPAGGLTKVDVATSVIDTTELRWFAPGPLPPGIRNGMSGMTGVTDRRCDSYLVDDRDGIGVKLRAGTTLELKVRQSRGEWIDLGDGLAGVPEEWRKWSPADDLVRVDSRSRWIAVRKVIIKRRFALDGTEVPFSHGPTTDMSGCDVEVVHVDVGGRSMWTIAFAAFGPPDSRRAALVSSWSAVAAGMTTTAALGTLDRAMSYPEWLTTMGHTSGADDEAEAAREPAAASTARSTRWARTLDR